MGVIKTVFNEFCILNSTKIVLNLCSIVSDRDSLICLIMFIVIPSLPGGRGCVSFHVINIIVNFFFRRRSKV